MKGLKPLLLHCSLCNVNKPRYAQIELRAFFWRSDGITARKTMFPFGNQNQEANYEIKGSWGSKLRAHRVNVSGNET